MAYEWTTGETITSEKLNSTGMVLACSYTDDGQKLILDKTAQEIIDALRSGMVVTVVEDVLEDENELSVYQCSGVMSSGTAYSFPFRAAAATFGPFLATSLSEYPAWTY